MLVKGPQCILKQQSPDSGVRTLQDGRIIKGEEQECALTINVFWLMLGDVGKDRLRRDVSPKVSTRVEP
jgi:hypothetical protein